MPVVNPAATFQSAPTVTVKPTAAPANNVPPLAKENSAYTSHGPRIAKVELLSPEEAKEFNDSLKPKPPAS